MQAPGGSSWIAMSLISGAFAKPPAQSLEMQNLSQHLEETKLTPQEPQPPQTLKLAPESEFKQLKHYCDQLLAVNDRLSKEMEDLKIILECANAQVLEKTSPNELLAKVQLLPEFHEWLKNSLGTNQELDELKILNKEMQKFRLTLQSKLDRWKSKYEIQISLDKELAASEPRAKLTSVSEIISALTTEIDIDLVSIFRQIEDTFQQHTLQMEKMINEKGALINQNLGLEDKIREMGAVLSSYQSLSPSYAEVTQELEKALKKLEEVKPRMDLLSIQLANSCNETQKVDQERIQQQEILKNKEQEVQSLKYQSLEVNAKLKNAESKIKEFELSHQSYTSLQETLQDVEQTLHKSREQGKADLALKNAALKQLEDQQKFLDDFSLLERSKFNSEESRRIQAENELAQLKEQHEDLLQHSNLLKEMDALKARNVLMVSFISTLSTNDQFAFKEKYENTFGPIVLNK